MIMFSRLDVRWNRIKDWIIYSILYLANNEIGYVISYLIILLHMNHK